MQTLPGNHAAVLTRQEDEARPDLRRLRRTAHGRRELVLGPVVHGRGHQGCPDWPGAHGVDADALADLLVVEAAGEGDDGAFGGGVVEEVRAADVGVDGGVVDDCVAALHMLEGVFGEVVVGVNVGVEGLEPLLSICIVYRISMDVI